MMSRASDAIHPIPAYAHAPILLLIIGFLMLQPLSTDLYLASLPSLATVFAVPASTVQLTLSLFVAGFGGAQLAIGPLSDRYGRRPVLLAGLSLYVVASLLCAAAPGIQLLIVARFLQALGCCSAIIIARAIVRDAYAPADSARVIARASSWLSLAPLLGPILGSYLQVGFGWRAAFVVHSILGLCLLAAVVMRLPETNAHKDPRATEMAGLVENFKLVLGAREFWANALPGALSYGSIFAFISGSSLVLIRVLNVPTEWFGYCFAFAVSGYLAGTIACRRLLPKFGQTATQRIGGTLSLTAGALFLMAVGFGALHWTLVVGAMFLTMFAHGISFPVAQSGSVTPFPRQAGTAAGLMGALTMSVAFLVGTAVGASFDGTLYPLAIIVCVLGATIFVSVRLIGATHAEVAP
ncbi:Bcr/CflA family drug resistance efflux transporter [Massilia eurypsychrophila]|uniref:Bcr/CflA family efflux transporter n=1 Tax=Massilia eurypsychrophila TaxID=1485217 RepID=A0A2G8TJ44_9BURK|nr:multidrug effflux MFS transporter [Massilia eurypsychrophila]PIL46076.1 Bcr/CflA family drug resistance efflux transporter [Massilia eurypsychrophila]